MRSETRRNRCAIRYCFRYCVCVCLLLSNVGIERIRAQELMCCLQAPGSCRDVCEKISLVKIAANGDLRNKTIGEVQQYCSPQLIPFWECLNSTFAEISRGELWPGRVCCRLPQGESCKRACVTATNIGDLSGICRRSDEMTFYNCLDRQEQGGQCCNKSENEECREACLNIFRSYPASPNKEQRDDVTERCDEHGSVLQCAKEFMKVTPATNLHNYLRCCDKTNKSRCRDTCRNILSTKSSTTIEDIMNELEAKDDCGPPLFQNPLWQCIFKEYNVSPAVEVSTIDKVGMDSAKWHCCQRASSNQCKNLCSKTFTKDWLALWQDFHSKCLSQLAEERLRSCIDEVDEPCELGCDGLSFCTNFNNRPTELFRSCTPESDEAARNDVTMWQTQHELSLPGLTLPLKNISKCSPNTWKAVACILQIKPCSRYSHSNQICRDVCLEILTDCADWSKIPPEFSPEGMCSRLSPDALGTSCITLQNYLFPSDASYHEGRVSSPCKNDPCGKNQICSINRNYTPGKSLPYACTPGCKLGEVSEYMVPIGTYVRIPFPKRCLQICKCTVRGIEECQPVPCVTLSPCWMGNSYEKAHGANFPIECNMCSCYVSEVICSKKQCETTSLSGKNTAYTTLPCNCPPHYVPVCGRNGNAYPSACLAKNIEG